MRQSHPSTHNHNFLKYFISIKFQEIIFKNSRFNEHIFLQLEMGKVIQNFPSLIVGTTALLHIPFFSWLKEYTYSIQRYLAQS